MRLHAAGRQALRPGAGKAPTKDGGMMTAAPAPAAVGGDCHPVAIVEG